MDGLKDLTDILSQYEWQEALSAGVGTIGGIAHAVYDRSKGNKRQSGFVSGGIGGFTAGINSDAGVIRGIGNGLVGLVAYNIAYYGTSKLLNRESNNK